MQASVEGLDAHTEVAILRAKFSGAPCCKSACNIVLQHSTHQGKLPMTVHVSAAMQRMPCLVSTALQPDKLRRTAACYYFFLELKSCVMIESGIISLPSFVAPATGSEHSGQYTPSASGKGRLDAFFPEQMPLTALNALPVGRLPAGTHQLRILCDRHTACAPRPQLIQLQRQELSAHAQLDITEGVDEACDPAAPCVRIAAADESPWVKELASEINLEHRTTSGGLPPTSASSPTGLLAVYGLYTVLVAGNVAAWRLAKAARCWVDGMGWVLAITAVYAS